MARTLSNRQREILAFIEEYIARHNYPPTIRDICDGCKISSTSVVDYNLNRLQELKYISRDSKVSRGITVLRPITVLQGNGAEREDETRVIPFPARSRQDRTPHRIYVWGTIAAGEPISVPDAETHPPDPSDFIELAHEMLRVSPDKRLFAMRVKGRSMIDALINDGDIVIFSEQNVCETGEMVAAWLKEEQQTTLKRFYPEGRRVRLQPENSEMEPIYCDADNVEIKGKVMMVIRRC